MALLRPGSLPWERDAIYRDCFQHLYNIERRRIPANAPTDMRLHRGERVELWPQAVQDTIWLSAQPGLVERYSFYPAFIEKVAAFAGVAPERIVLGAGIEEFIRTLTFLCCDPQDVVASTWPSCAMYDLYPQIFGAAHARINTPLDGDWYAARVIDQIPNSTTLVFVVNPSQPVDVCLPVDEMWHVAKHCRDIGAVLAIDEAYYGFGAPTCLPLVDEFDNVLVLRTFSKAMGAASIRVGYAIGQHRVLKPLDAARPSGEIAGPSMHVASVLMDMFETHIKPGIRAVCDGRDWLNRTLNENGHAAWGDYSNFVLVNMLSDKRAAAVAAKLRERGIFVRYGLPAPFSHCLMITCGSQPLMARFYDEFRGAL